MGFLSTAPFSRLYGWRMWRSFINCFILFLPHISSRPVVRFSNDSFVDNSTDAKIDTSIFITLKEDDWRDAHDGRMIIWSHESQFHPDYGRANPMNNKYFQRPAIPSQLTSFCILGSVIGFILYTYFSHVLMMRKLNKEQEASRLRELVHRSALIMAGSAQRNDHHTFAERRRSLINMFKAFKL